MATKPLTDEQCREAITALAGAGSAVKAAIDLGLSRHHINDRVREAKVRGIKPAGGDPEAPSALKTTIRKLQAELRTAQAESNESAAVKAIIGKLKERIEDLDPPNWVSKPPAAHSSPGVPFLFLSDFHWAEKVHPTQIGGVNEFNLSIARERLTYTVETAIHLLRILDQKMDYPGIVVALGGDMISGNIHDELTATNEINSMPAVLDLYARLIAAITRMADVFGSVFLPCVSGNHGRDTRKIWTKDRHHTSFDWLLYRFLAKHFEGDSRVQFFVPDSSDALFRIYDKRFLLTHGDQFRGGDSIIGPLGPLTRGNQKKQARNQAINQEFDVMMCGHWHQYIHLSRLIVNGSLKGYDEYAYQNNFGFEEPQQALFVVHPRHGITYRMPVNCDQRPKGPPSSWVSWNSGFKAAK